MAHGTFHRCRVASILFDIELSMAYWIILNAAVLWTWNHVVFAKSIHVLVGIFELTHQLTLARLNVDLFVVFLTPHGVCLYFVDVHFRPLYIKFRVTPLKTETESPDSFGFFFLFWTRLQPCTGMLTGLQSRKPRLNSRNSIRVKLWCVYMSSLAWWNRGIKYVNAAKFCC